MITLNFKEKEELLFQIVILALVVLRFINLTTIPIFIDEQTHLRMGEGTLKHLNSPFFTVQSRIFPVVPWILGIFQIILGWLFNPLLLGRIVMVFADLLSAFFIYLIGKNLFEKRFGVICAIVYLSLPLNFFHSRTAVLEPVTSMFFLAALHVFIGMFLKSKSLLKSGVLTGLLLALSFLSKPTAIASFTALPFAFIFVFINEKANFKKVKKDLPKILILMSVAIIITLPIVASVWSEFSDLFVWKNLELMVVNFKRNLWLTWWWSKAYLTLPIIFLAAISLLYALYFKKIKILWVFFWLASTIFLVTLFALYFFPRHLFPIAAPVSICTAFIIWDLSRQISKSNWSLVALFMLIFSLFLSWKADSEILFRQNAAPIALEDRQQFFEDWTSGEGLKGVSKELKNLSRNNQIIVLTEADGSFAWALSRLYDVGNSKIIESDSVNTDYSVLKVDEGINKEGSKIYIVLNRHHDAPMTWPVTLISSHPKKGQVRSINIYRYESD